jgi:hypothetical protein
MKRFELQRPQLILIAIVTLSVLLGGGYVFSVPPGLPYDEPPHFNTVRYYATNVRLPVLGAPGTNYEAYQAPLYYALLAPLDRLVRPLGLRTEFYVLRSVGLLLLAPLGFFAYRVTKRVFGNESTLALLATAFVCLNPALLGIASSIQNDMLSIVLSFWILDAVGRYVQDDPLTTRSALQLGLLISVAMLTKMSVVFFPIPIGWFVWSRHGKKSAPYIAAMMGVIALCTGWWFARNKMLYGDLMGVTAMLKYVGQSPPHISLWKPVVLIPYLRNFLAYTWLPIDYFRSLIKSDLWERSIIMSSTLFAVAGWWIARKDAVHRTSEKQDDYRRFLFLAYGVCFAIYFYTYVTKNPYPPRVLYPMFLVYAVFYAYGLCRLFRRYTPPNVRLAVGAFSLLLVMLCFAMCRKANGYRTIDFLPEVNHYQITAQSARN